MASNTNHKGQAPQLTDVPATRSPALEPLNALVGVWSIEFIHVALPDPVHGQKTFEWLEGGHFLIERSHMEHPEVPDSISIYSTDNAARGLAQHYFDSRGVYRVMKMSLRDGTWKVWRDEPGFSQRFTGTFSDDGNTIKILGELSKDGVKWERDFEQIYTKIGASES
jgi:hypothetical protein